MAYSPPQPPNLVQSSTQQWSNSNQYMMRQNPPAPQRIISLASGNNGVRPANPGSNGSSAQVTTNDPNSSGYTILVPANVRFRGVNMKLDLKIDQKTLAAAESLSKAVQDQMVKTRSTNLNVPSPSAGTSSTSDEFELNETGPLSSNLRRKTGGRNPRELLAEKLKKAVKKQKEKNTVKFENLDLPQTSQVETSLAPNKGMSPAASEHDLNIVSINPLRLPEPELLTRQQKHLFSDLVTNGNELDLSVPLSSKLPLLNGDSAAHIVNGVDAGPSIVENGEKVIPVPLPVQPSRRRSHGRAKGKSDTEQSRCTNAVRKDKELPYCSTHLIMMGMLEPKKKKRVSKPEENGPIDDLNLFTGLEPMEPSPSFNDNGAPSTDWPSQGYFPNESPAPLDGFAASPSHMNGNEPLNPFAILSSLGSPMPSPSYNINNGYQGQNMGHNQQFMITHNGPTPNVNGTPIGGFSPNSSSFARSSSVASASSRPESTLSLSGGIGPPPHTPGLQSATFGAQGLFDMNSGPGWKRPSSPISSDLSRNYPELASKLLPPPPTSSGATMTSLQPMGQQHQDDIKPEPFLRPDSSHYLPSAQRPSPSLISPRVGPETPQNEPLPSLAGTLSPLWGRPGLSQANQPSQAAQNQIQGHNRQLNQVATVSNNIIQSPASRSPSVADQQNGANNRKVIRLRQKREHLRMVGQYRQIPAVNQMCKMLEDSDYDKYDLFPLGLEPSSSDTESEEGECSVGSRMTERCFASSLVDFQLPNMDTLDSTTTTAARRQLYLLKKQLRFERHRLLTSARTNAAAVMPAARRYPNSVGRALSDRKRTRPTSKRKLHRLKKLRAKSGGKCEKHHASFFDIGMINGKCCQNGCVLTRLPYSNHCAKHILYNIDQRLFRYCSEPQCQQPVLDLACQPTMLASARCAKHLIQVRPPSAETQTSSTDGGERRKRFPSQRRIRRRRPKIRPNEIKQEEMDESEIEPEEPQMASSPMPVDSKQDQSSSDPSVSSGTPLSNSVEGLSVSGGSGVMTVAVKTDGELSLASVAKDLGFEDDKELTEMLNKLPEDAFSSLMAHDFGKNGEHASVLSSSTMLNARHDTPLDHPEPVGDMGHSWADVEQFLLSEGYRGTSFGHGMVPEHSGIQSLPPMSSLTNMEPATFVPPPPPYAWPQTQH